MYEIKMQKLDTYIDNLNNNIKIILNKKEQELDKIKLSYILQNPKALINEKRNKYSLLVNTLKLVNPLGILEKGYSLVTIDNKIIKSNKDLKENDIIDIRLHEGNVKAMVKEIEKG